MIKKIPLIEISLILFIVIITICIRGSIVILSKYVSEKEEQRIFDEHKKQFEELIRISNEVDRSKLLRDNSKTK